MYQNLMCMYYSCLKSHALRFKFCFDLPFEPKIGIFIYVRYKVKKITKYFSDKNKLCVVVKKTDQN